jgi:sigma-B regulation protein RsbU (phosphoserine phosphatase)
MNAAVCLVLLGLALGLTRKADHRRPSEPRERSGQILAGIVALVGLLTLTEHVFGWDLGIDQLLFREPAADAFFSRAPGLIAPITALEFLLLGLGLILLDKEMSWRSRRYWPTQYLAACAAILSIGALLDFVLGSHISYTHIALQTAVTLLVVSLGLLFVRTERGLAALIASSTTGGALTRRLLPAAVVSPIAIGVLTWNALTAGRYSEWGAISLMVIVMITLLGAFAVWNGSIVDRGDLERRRTEGALHRSEMELRGAQRLAQMGSWWWKPSTDTVTWSAGLSHLTWRDPMLPPPTFKEHLGFHTPQSSARLAAAIDESLRTGAPYELDVEMVRADGATRQVTERGEVERDSDGQVVLMRGTVLDITARKHAEEALRESESNLRRAQEIAHIGSWYLDVARNQLTWSDEVFRMFGVPQRTALTYEAFVGLIHPEDREAVNAAWAAALHGAAYDIEHRIVVGGAVKWVRERAQVEFDTDGHAARGIGTVQDITARKLAEAEIRALNAELEQRVTARTAELHAANKELELAREREIEIGFRIQQTLLFDQPPTDVPGLRVAALTIPSQRIDGDFYIFIRHSDAHLDVIVGDVMGKGIPAALLGAATKSHFLKALSDLVGLSKDGQLPEPKEIVMLAHAELVRHLIDLDSFVTLVYARFDEGKRRLDLVDCGHTGTVHFHGGTGLCELVHGDNLPLGIREGEIYDQISVRFEPGDVLLFFSDGITEARNAAGDQFGAARLEACVASNGQLEPGALVEAIRKAVFTFSESNELSDDLTTVAVKIEEPKFPIARAEMEIASDLTQLRGARNFVRSFCRSLPGRPLDDESAGALELAVNEAASNIVKHAYRGRSDQWIHLEAEAFPGHVAVRLHHLGDPFNPSEAAMPTFDGSRESGFGAYIIARSVDEVRYYRDERGRNCVALVKNRTRPS